MKNFNELKNIAKKYKLDLFILFGSRAKKNHTKKSDYDFAFYKRKYLNINKEIELFDEITKLLKNKKIDLININTNHGHKLRNEIFQTGKSIFESEKGLFVNLKWRAWFDYKDCEEQYKLKNQLLNNELKKMVTENNG